MSATLGEIASQLRGQEQARRICGEPQLREHALAMFAGDPVAVAAFLAEVDRLEAERVSAQLPEEKVENPASDLIAVSDSTVQKRPRGGCR